MQILGWKLSNHKTRTSHWQAPFPTKSDGGRRSRNTDLISTTYRQTKRAKQKQRHRFPLLSVKELSKPNSGEIPVRGSVILAILAQMPVSCELLMVILRSILLIRFQSTPKRAPWIRSRNTRLMMMTKVMKARTLNHLPPGNLFDHRYSSEPCRTIIRRARGVVPWQTKPLWKDWIRRTDLSTTGHWSDYDFSDHSRNG